MSSSFNPELVSILHLEPLSGDNDFSDVKKDESCNRVLACHYIRDFSEQNKSVKVQLHNKVHTVPGKLHQTEQ